MSVDDTIDGTPTVVVVVFVCPSSRVFNDPAEERVPRARLEESPRATRVNTVCRGEATQSMRMLSESRSDGRANEASNSARPLPRSGPFGSGNASRYGRSAVGAAARAVSDGACEITAIG